MRPSAAVSDFGGRRYRRFSQKQFWRPQGPLIREFEVSMDASFQAGSNDTIGGHVRHRRPDISPPFHGGGHIGPHLRHHMRLFTLTPTGGGKGGDGNLPSSHGGGPLQPQLRHQNRLFSANVALFSMLNRPDCRQKEGGKGAAGERVKRICICFFGLRFTNETSGIVVFDLTISYSSEGSPALAVFRHH